MLATTQEQDEREFARELRESTIPVRLARKQMGRTRKLTAEQHARQAAVFSADPTVVRGSKSLLDSKHPKLKAINRVMQRARKDWIESTYDCPGHDGIRLLRIADRDEFDARMRQYQADLDTAMAEAQEEYEAILSNMQHRLGDLWDRDDYPDTLIGQWAIEVDNPSIEPDARLAQINPEAYRRQMERAEQRMQHAVELFEAAMAEELKKLTEVLVDRLKPQQVDVYRYEDKQLAVFDGDEEGYLQMVADPSKFVESRSITNVAEEIAAVRQEITEADELLTVVNPDHEDYDELSANQERRKSHLELLEQQAELQAAESIERRGDKITLTYEKDSEWSRANDGKTTKTFTVSDAHLYLCDRGCSHSRTKVEEKSFRESTVSNFGKFFETFAKMNLGSSQDLDRIVEEAKQAVAGIDAGELRKTEQEKRDVLRQPLESLSATLDQLLIERPQREFNFDDDFTG